MVGTWGLPGLSLAAVEQPEEELGARSASSSGSRWPLAEGYVWAGKGESDFPSLLLQLVLFSSIDSRKRRRK